MGVIRINRKRSKRKFARVTYIAKPISLPTFSFYGHLPVVYADGQLVFGRRVVPLEPCR